MDTKEEGLIFASNLIGLRKKAGLSQQETAGRLGMARATYSNLENAKRSPTLDEIKSISSLFEITPSSLIDAGLSLPNEERVRQSIRFKEAPKDIVPREVVREKVETLREVLLYVLDRVGAKPNVGETVLYKLLYFIDFDYFEKTGKSITGLSYVRNQFGPTPSKTFNSVVETMEEAGELERVTSKYFKYPQKKYLPIKKPHLENISGDEIHHIDDVLARLGDKTADELTSLSHRDMPWLATKDRQVIDYQLAMYRTADTSAKESEDEL